MPDVDEILQRFEGARRSGAGYMVRCPTHRDEHGSLSIAPGRSGGVVMHCHAGCETSAVLAAVGLTFTDLAGNNGDERRIVATYDYTDEQGRLLYQVVRFMPKNFRQRKPDGKGGWTWKLGNVRRVLFGLPELRGQKVAYVIELCGAPHKSIYDKRSVMWSHSPCEAAESSSRPS